MIHHKLFSQKEIQAMSKHTTVLGNLLSHLDRSEFEKAVREHNGNKGTRTLDTYLFFKGMVYGQITSSYSVREIESSLEAQSTKLYHCGLATIKRTTFCDALEKRDQKIFEKVFQSLVEKANRISSKTGKKFKNPLKIIDASTIDLCLKRFDWAKFRTTKGAVKLHVRLNGDSLFPEQVKLTEGAIHEVNELPSLCQDEGMINTFDRGYVDYKKLSDIDLNKSFFVTRMKTNCKYECVKVLACSEYDPIRLDTVIRFTGVKSKKHYPQNLRLVIYHDDEYDRDYQFITNNFKLSAREIADIYKERWQVELFFKWIKQNLKIKTFWGTSRNAVFTQIWVALIVFMLLWINKAIEGLSATPQRIIQILKTTILLKKTIVELFEIHSPPKKERTIQLYFHEFKN